MFCSMGERGGGLGFWLLAVEVQGWTTIYLCDMEALFLSSRYDFILEGELGVTGKGFVVCLD
jgi:hypothetical protein